MKKNLLSILILLFQLIHSDSDIIPCLINDWCMDGKVTVEVDNLGHKPNACCRVEFESVYCDSEGDCDYDDKYECYQMNTGYIKDYLSSIYDDIDKHYKKTTNKLIIYCNAIEYYDYMAEYYANHPLPSSRSSSVKHIYEIKINFYLINFKNLDWDWAQSPIPIEKLI